jgi:signal transduction histidine kinase
VRDEIFKPLVTTKRATGGTGIGLAICQRVVESMGGLITVDSEPEKGATFSVSLPLHRQDESRTLETPNANTHH